MFIVLSYLKTGCPFGEPQQFKLISMKIQKVDIMTEFPTFEFNS